MPTWYGPNEFSLHTQTTKTPRTRRHNRITCNVATMETEEANALLPSAPTKAPTDARRLKYLIIGPPKWGKTTFLCSVPDSLLLATEEGHAFHETHKVII